MVVYDVEVRGEPNQAYRAEEEDASPQNDCFVIGLR
jgi:hypothetical protein